MHIPTNPGLDLSTKYVKLVTMENFIAYVPVRTACLSPRIRRYVLLHDGRMAGDIVIVFKNRITRSILRFVCEYLHHQRYYKDGPPFPIPVEIIPELEFISKYFNI